MRIRRLERGERGPKGDHGQSGDSIKGDKGERGRSSFVPWVVLTIAFVIVGFILTRDYNRTNRVVMQNASSIKQLQDNKANIHQLQKSNCTLRLFLANARLARYQAANNETGPKKRIDTNAMNAYTQLIRALDGHSYCPLPQKLLLPEAKIN